MDNQDFTFNNIDSFVISLKQTPNDYRTIADCLRYLRQTKLRRSDLVTQYATKLLKEKPNMLTEIEVWDVQEQLFIASLDTNQLVIAANTLLNIKNQFGEKSTRVKRLMGLHKEALGKFKEAEQIYKSILESDPTNMAAMKRQIAIRKAIGDITSTIKLLNEYLKIFMGDADAWQELADLYLDQQMYKNAAFCYEELILASPANHHLHYKYAEILYTMGGYENLRTARKYYSHSLQMCEINNMRALYGLLMTTIAIGSIKQGKQEIDRGKDPENSLLYEWAYKKLQEKSTNSSVNLLKAFNNKGKAE